MQKVGYSKIAGLQIHYHDSNILNMNDSWDCIVMGTKLHTQEVHTNTTKKYQKNLQQIQEKKLIEVNPFQLKNISYNPQYT